MALYHYTCPTCGTEAVSTERGDRLHRVCAGCGSIEPLRRVFGFAHKPSMPEHFSNTLGRPVSSMHDFKDGLKEASDRATLETGIEHSYVPVEWGDKDALGVTGDGIHESNIERSKRGEMLLPEID